MAFKSEEEVKEYLQNLGTEYRFSCFSEKNSEGCHLLADYLESVKQDFESAAQVYKTNCDDNNHPKSCLKIGNYNYLGKAMESNLQAAFNYYVKGCKLDQADSCLHCGVILTHDQTGPFAKDPNLKKDMVQGLKYLEKACTLGNINGCFYASGMHISGAEGIPMNRSKAAELSEKACEGGNIFACMNLSRMYKIGDGVEKDEKKSELYKQKAKDIRDDHKRKPSIGFQQSG